MKKMIKYLAISIIVIIAIILIINFYVKATTKKQIISEKEANI